MADIEKLPPIIDVHELPETYEDCMSPIEWLAVLTNKVNELIDRVEALEAEVNGGVGE